MSRSSYDVLFLDFYGTLVTGDRQAVEDTCAQVVRDLGLAMTAPELAVEWGERFFEAIGECNHDRFLTLFDCELMTLRDVLEPVVGSFDPTPYADMLKAYWMSPPLAPNAAETLAALDVPVCVVSNADTEDVHAAIARHHLQVTEVVTSEDARSYKPDPVIFETALAKMSVHPQRVLHAGDSLHSDVGGAAKLGIASCWVHYDDRILDVGNGQPDHKIRDLKELRAIL